MTRRTLFIFLPAIIVLVMFSAALILMKLLPSSGVLL